MLAHPSIARVRWIPLDAATRRGRDPDAARQDAAPGPGSLAHPEDVRAVFARSPVALAFGADLPATWLYAALVVAAEREGVAARTLAGVARNDALVGRLVGSEPRDLSASRELEVARELALGVLERSPAFVPALVPADRLAHEGVAPTLALAVSLGAARCLVEACQERLDRRDLSRLAGRIAFAVPADDRAALAATVAELWGEMARPLRATPRAVALATSSGPGVARIEPGSTRARGPRELVSAVRRELEAIEARGGLVRALPWLAGRVRETRKVRPGEVRRARSLRSSVELALRLRALRAARDPAELRASRVELESSLVLRSNLVAATIDAVRSGVTLGEWSACVRERLAAPRRAAA